MKKVSIILLLFLTLFLLTSCRNEKTDLNDKDPILSEKNHGLRVIFKNNNIDLIKLFRPIESNVKCTWSSSNEIVATVDENGAITCFYEGVTEITRVTDNNMLDKVKIIVETGDPSNYLVDRYDFLRIRIISNEEYNQYMREYYNTLDESYEFQDAWFENKEYKLVYVEVMECYNNTQNDNYRYNVGQITSFAIPKSIYEIYKDYDEIVLSTSLGRVKTLDNKNELVETNVDILMYYYDYSSDFYLGLPIKDNKAYVSNLKDLGIDLNNSLLFKVVNEYSLIERQLEINDGTTIEELTEMFNYMVNYDGKTIKYY